MKKQNIKDVLKMTKYILVSFVLFVIVIFVIASLAIVGLTRFFPSLILIGESKPFLILLLGLSIVLATALIFIRIISRANWNLMIRKAFVAGLISATIIIAVVITVSFAYDFSPVGYTFDVAVSQEGYVFVVDGTRGMKVFELNSDRTKMELISFLFPPTGHYFRNIKIQGNYAFIADRPKSKNAVSGGGIIAVDISDPYNPKIVGMAGKGHGCGLFIKDNYAYVADSQEGLVIYDIKDPTSMKVIGTCNTPGTTWDVWVSGDYAFIADLEKGLSIVDVSNQALPKHIAQTSWEGTTQLFTMSLESQKYLRNGTISKQLLNIFTSNSLSLREADIVVKENEDRWIIMENDEESYIIQKEEEKLNVYMVHDSAEIVRGEENFVYVAAGIQGLKVINVSNPFEPEVTSQFKYTNDACAEGLTVRDNLLYLANGNYADPADSGLLIIDVSDPPSPKVIGKSSFSGWVEGVALFEDRVFVANTHEGTALIDISNIKKPLFLSRAPGYGKIKLIILALKWEASRMWE